MKRLASKVLNLFLAITMVVTQVFVAPIYAENNTVYARDESGETYYSISDAWQAAIKGKKITMECDWNVNSYLEVPDNSEYAVTIDMNGYKISRNLTSAVSHGYVIEVGNYSTLSLLGSTNRTFTYTGKGNYGKDSVTSGGLITGGYNSNAGGGIYLTSGANLYMSNVTVAGNYTERYGGGIYGANVGCQVFLKNGSKVMDNGANYGAGIYMSMKHSSISLDNSSTIAYNYANKDGGGVYFNGTYPHLFLSNSSSIKNNSAENGGGVYFNYTYITLKSNDNTGSISNNRARIGGGYGGGVYICKDVYDESLDRTDNLGEISGIEFDSNSANEDGGAIYIHQENITISNCSITNNVASDEGGGIYNNNDGTTISSTTIKNNTSSNSGGGVFTSCYNDITLNGKMYIIDNKRSDGSADNLFLSWSSGVLKAYVMGNPKGEVGIRINKATTRKIGKTTTYFDESVFSFDLGGNYHIAYDSSSKELNIVAGAPQETIKATEVSPDTSSTGKTYNGKDLIQGYFSFLSVDDSYMDSDSNFYYSDGYFLDGENGDNDDPTIYNEHLATTSMAMAISAFYSSVGSDGKLSDSLDINKQYGDRSYTYKSQNIKKFLTDIGVKQEDIFINDFNSVKPTTGSIGVAIGKKSITDIDGDEYILVPIAIRGQGYESEWASNVTVGESGEEGGFASAADTVFDTVKDYIENYNLEDYVTNGKVKFWIAGYSRAGATANLTAKRLIEEYCSGESFSTSNQVYAYCFEAPQGGINTAMKLDESKYYSIHNCINMVDLVPLVAPEEMGFIRYGVDHYVPGSSSDEVETDSTVWSILKGKDWASTYKTWHDNTAYEVGSSNYDTSEMLKHLVSINKDIHFTDYFKIADFDITGFVVGDIVDEVDYTGEGITQSEYLRIFWRALLSWGLYECYNGDYRNSYATKIGDLTHDDFTPYPFQKALQSIIEVVFSKTATEQSEITTCLSYGASAFIDNESYVSIYDDLLGDWCKLSDEERIKWTSKFWYYFMYTKNYETNCTASSYFTSDELEKLEASFYTIVDIVFRIVDTDYVTKAKNWNSSHSAVSDTTTPLTEGITSKETNYGSDSEISILTTIYYNMSAIAQGHYPEINFAWLRTYDSFYSNDGNSPISIVTDKKATVTIDEASLNSRKLVLNTDTTGSSVFYRIKESNGTYSNWKPYNTAVDLLVKDNKEATYTIQYTAIYCDNITDVKEETVTVKGKYTLSVNDDVYGYYDAGDIAIVNGSYVDSSKVFKSWNDVEGIITKSNRNNVDVTITMPDSDLNLIANYVTCIGDDDGLTLSVDVPVANKQLASTGTLTWGEGNSLTVNVTWVEVLDGKTNVAGEYAQYGATYYAYVKADQDLDKDIAFNVTKEGVTVKYGNGVYSAETVTINPDGSLFIFGSAISTEKIKITAVAETSVNVSSPNKDDIVNALPNTALITGNDGNTYTVEVDKDKVDYTNALNKDDSFKDNPYVTIPLKENSKFDNSNKIVLKVNLNVNSLSPASAPTSNIESGTYKNEIKVALSTATEGGIIEYSINDGEAKTYSGEIVLSANKGEKKTYVIKAHVVGKLDGYAQSSETILNYVVENPYTVTVIGKDTGLKKDELFTKTFSFYKDETIKIGAPLEKDEQFVKWENIPDGVTGEVSDNILTVSTNSDVTLTAIYNPIVNKIEIELDQPFVGENLNTAVKSAMITVTNTYDFTKYIGEVTWAPSDKKAAYGSSYTARLELNADIEAIMAGTTIIVNNDSSIKANVVKENGKYVMYINFPMTEKTGLVSIDELSDMVVSRIDASSENWNLPSETNVSLTDGSTIKASIEWDSLPTFDSSNKYAQQSTAYGKIILPDNVVALDTDRNISISVLISACQRAEEVKANIESGTFESAKYIELSCDTDNATIYYTLDGSEPTENSLVYDGNPIKITETTTLKAIAVRNDLLNSFPVEYTYTISSSETPDSGGDDSSVVTCEDAYGKDWTWSEKKKACVYKVSNTEVK